LIIALAGGALSFAPPLAELPIAGYASIALIILATIVAIPSLLQRLLRPIPSLPNMPAELAISHLRGSGPYATLSVAAIVVSFSLMVAMLIMVTSFRSSLDAWTEKILPADVYLRVGYIGQSAFLDESQRKALAAVPGVARMATARFARLTLEGSTAPLTIVARELDVDRIEDEIWLKERASPPIASGIPVWIYRAAADHDGSRACNRLASKVVVGRLSCTAFGATTNIQTVRCSSIMRRTAPHRGHIDQRRVSVAPNVTVTRAAADSQRARQRGAVRHAYAPRAAPPILRCSIARSP
jgi:putative ABC transport system permease protein